MSLGLSHCRTAWDIAARNHRVLSLSHDCVPCGRTASSFLKGDLNSTVHKGGMSVVSGSDVVNSSGASASAGHLSVCLGCQFPGSCRNRGVLLSTWLFNSMINASWLLTECKDLGSLCPFACTPAMNKSYPLTCCLHPSTF